jgi:peptide deformylase
MIDIEENEETQTTGNLKFEIEEPDVLEGKTFGAEPKVVEREIDPENIRKLVSSLDGILTTKIEPFDFKNPPIDPTKLQEILYDNMLKYNGIGLACNQIGLPYRAFIMRGTPSIVCINPRIVDVSESTVMIEEGCLTYPDLFVPIKRPAIIKVRYQDPMGEVQTEKFSGMTARIFQHEMDHMEGLRCFARASRYHMDKAKRDRKKIQRNRKRFNKLPLATRQRLQEQHEARLAEEELSNGTLTFDTGN